MKGSFCAVTTIICVIIWVDISWWNYIYIVSYYPTRSYCCASSYSRCWLFTIIKSFKHTIISTISYVCFGQQKVILKYTLTLVVTNWYDSILFFWSVVLNILHESWLSFIHHVILSIWRYTSWWIIIMLPSFISIRIKETCGSCILTNSKICHIHILILVFISHYYKTVILLSSISLEISIWLCYYLGPSHWTTSIWEFASLILFIRFVQSICMAICSRFSATTYCCMSSRRIYSILLTRKYSHINLSPKLIKICYVVCIICLVTKNGLFSLVIRYWHILIYSRIELSINLIIYSILIFDCGSIN